MDAAARRGPRLADSWKQGTGERSFDLTARGCTLQHTNTQIDTKNKNWCFQQVLQRTKNSLSRKPHLHVLQLALPLAVQVDPQVAAQGQVGRQRKGLHRVCMGWGEGTVGEAVMCVLVTAQGQVGRQREGLHRACMGWGQGGGKR